MEREEERFYITTLSYPYPANHIPLSVKLLITSLLTITEYINLSCLSKLQSINGKPTTEGLHWLQPDRSNLLARIRCTNRKTAVR